MKKNENKASLLIEQKKDTIVFIFNYPTHSIGILATLVPTWNEGTNRKSFSSIPYSLAIVSVLVMLRICSFSIYIYLYLLQIRWSDIKIVKTIDRDRIIGRELLEKDRRFKMRKHANKNKKKKIVNEKTIKMKSILSGAVASLRFAVSFLVVGIVFCKLQNLRDTM